MQIHIGQKIKELRQRDGRTQEAMAGAIGVTPQAISRWEACGGYPDLEILPVIANYFHVTIDELFGYSEDREKKLRDIMDQATLALDAQGDLTDCIAMLRDAAEEFPAEPMILVKLGYALNHQGWHRYGCKLLTDQGKEYSRYDVEYNAQNPYWRESAAAFERVLSMDIPDCDRTTILYMLTHTYAQMGEDHKAVALAERQPPIMASRELLLAEASDGEQSARYQGEALLTLLDFLQSVTIHAVSHCRTMNQPGYNKEELFLALIRCYEAVCCDGNLGSCHAKLTMLYFEAAWHTARIEQDDDKALSYLAKGLEHLRMLRQLPTDRAFSYTAPLVAKVTVPAGQLANFHPGYLHLTRDSLPQSLVERMRGDDTYREFFE